MKKTFLLVSLLLVFMTMGSYAESMPIEFSADYVSPNATEIQDLKIRIEPDTVFYEADAIELINNGNKVYVANKIINHTIEKFYEVPVFSKVQNCIRGNGVNSLEVRIIRNKKVAATYNGFMSFRGTPFLKPDVAYDSKTGYVTCTLLNCPIGQDSKLNVYDDFISDKAKVGEVLWADSKYDAKTNETVWVGKLYMNPGWGIGDYSRPLELVYKNAVIPAEDININVPYIMVCSTEDIYINETIKRLRMGQNETVSSGTVLESEPEQKPVITSEANISTLSKGLNLGMRRKDRSVEIVQTNGARTVVNLGPQVKGEEDYERTPEPFFQSGYLYTADISNGLIQIMPDGTQKKVVEGAYVQFVQFDTKNKVLYFLNREGVHRYDPTTGAIRIIFKEEGIRSFNYSENTNHISVILNNRALVLEGVNGRALKTIPLELNTEGAQIVETKNHGVYILTKDTELLWVSADSVVQNVSKNVLRLWYDSSSDKMYVLSGSHSSSTLALTNGKQSVVLIEKVGEIQAFDSLLTWNAMQGNTKYQSVIATSYDKIFFVIKKQNEIYLYDGIRSKMSAAYKIEDSYQKIVFIDNGPKALYINVDNYGEYMSGDVIVLNKGTGKVESILNPKSMEYSVTYDERLICPANQGYSVYGPEESVVKTNLTDKPVDRILGMSGSNLVYLSERQIIRVNEKGESQVIYQTTEPEDPYRPMPIMRALVKNDQIFILDEYSTVLIWAPGVKLHEIYNGVHAIFEIQEENPIRRILGES